MIGRIKGTLIYRTPPHLMVEAGGVGYEMQAPMPLFATSAAVGDKVCYYTHFSVREDAHLLYAFSSMVERDLFRDLIKTSGIGPKIALTMLSAMQVPDLVNAVQLADEGKLQTIPGIGSKTAKRLILEMRERLSGRGWDVLADEIHPRTVAAPDAIEEAHRALVSLGYRNTEARIMIQKLKDTQTKTAEAIVREALRSRGGRSKRNQQ